MEQHKRGALPQSPNLPSPMPTLTASPQPQGPSPSHDSSPNPARTDARRNRDDLRTLLCSRQHLPGFLGAGKLIFYRASLENNLQTRRCRL